MSDTNAVSLTLTNFKSITFKYRFQFDAKTERNAFITEYCYVSSNEIKTINVSYNN